MFSFISPEYVYDKNGYKLKKNDYVREISMQNRDLRGTVKDYERYWETRTENGTKKINGYKEQLALANDKNQDLMKENYELKLKVKALEELLGEQNGNRT